ncbi:MAG TPA: glycosyltransferase family 2 protein [Planctomycetota bacterium]|nr:glycosyltransferase family 2 protein [Planctomycetota bacterium]
MSTPAMAELSVLIVNYNTWRECAGAIATLRQHGPTRPDGSPMPFECIVVDNRSPQQDPALVEAVREQLRLLAQEQGDPLAGQLILHTENGGYSKGMNLAFGRSRGRWILVSNPDLVFTEGLVSTLQRHLENDPRAGCVVPKGFWDSDFSGHLPPNTLPTLADVMWTTWGEFSRTISRWHARRLARQWLRVWAAEVPLALPMMSGCLFLIEREFFVSIGKFDERYPLYYEDSDLSVKIRKAGRTVTQVPGAHLIHFVNRSGMSDLETMWERHHVSRALYYRKWYGRVGTMALAVSHWLLHSPRLRKWHRFKPVGPVVDLGESTERPVIVLPRHCEHYLVLMSLDPRFYLSAGLYGSGDQWTPGDNAYALFVNATFFFAAYDLTNGAFERLGTWRYVCLSHLGTPVPHRATKPAAVVAAGEVAVGEPGAGKAAP